MMVQIRATTLKTGTRHVFGGLLLVIALAFLTVLTTTSFQACPLVGSHKDSAISVFHLPSTKVIVASATSASKEELKATDASHCQRASFHVSGPACVSGCCPPCSAALPTVWL